MSIDNVHIADMVSSNLALLLKLQNSSPHSEILAGSGVTWIVADVDHLLGNCVLAGPLTVEQAEQAIRETQNLYGQLQHSCLWEVSSSSTPVDLAQRLRAAGFWQLNTMTDMSLAAPFPSLATNPQIQVKTVQTFEQWREFNRIVGHCFGLDPDLCTWLDAVAACPDTLRLWREQLIGYLGYLNSEPVATTMSLLQGDVLGIYNVATLPAYRGYGIARTLIGQQLDDASHCRYAVLQAGPVGMYRRMGFAAAGQSMRFMWTPPRV